MKVELTYPHIEKRRLTRRAIIDGAKWPFLLAAYVCPIINLWCGGPAWSVIVLFALWVDWTAMFAPTMVEYNRISQPIKLIIDTCILLVLIDVLLSPGWAVKVVPIVCFGGLMLAAVLFFTDINRQKQNMMPLLWLTLLALIGSIVGLILWRQDTGWAMIITCASAFALLIVYISVMGEELLRELKKRFHTK